MCIAATALYFAVRSLVDDRNARLVEIGVRILMVDPDKEEQIKAARGWAIDLIDANAGGVKFAADARAALLNHPLKIGGRFYDDGAFSGTFYPDVEHRGIFYEDKTKQNRPPSSREPPR